MSNAAPQSSTHLAEAALQAGQITSALLIGELAQKLAANRLLAEQAQLLRSSLAATTGQLDETIKVAKSAQQSGALARARLDVVHDALAQAFGHKGEAKPDLEVLLDRARAASDALDNLQNFRSAVRDLVDEGRLLTEARVVAPDSELLLTLEAVLRGKRGCDEESVDADAVSRLRAVMGHLRGNRIPSAISLLDAVIDELTSEIEPPHRDPDQEDELAQATAADRIIKESKEDSEPPM